MYDINEHNIDDGLITALDADEQAGVGAELEGLDHEEAGLDVEQKDVNDDEGDGSDDEEEEDDLRRFEYENDELPGNRRPGGDVTDDDSGPDYKYEAQR